MNGELASGLLQNGVINTEDMYTRMLKPREARHVSSLYD